MVEIMDVIGDSEDVDGYLVDNIVGVIEGSSDGVLLGSIENILDVVGGSLVGSALGLIVGFCVSSIDGDVLGNVVDCMLETIV